MKIVLGMVREPSGAIVYCEFECIIDYEIEQFKFATGPFRDADNFVAILKRVAEIDTLRTVRLKGTNSIRLEQVDVRLDVSVTFYSSPLVAWTMTVPGWPERLNRSQRRLRKRVHNILSDRFRIMEPVIVGTVRVLFEDLKEAVRDAIRKEALRRARMMRANAEAIITFLNAPLDYQIE